ncbi:relaxase/mobilization nuclease domain-containing protein [Sunxiuqinia elliptica]
MIGKAKACVGGTALIGYVVNSKKGYELERRNISGNTPKQLYESMQVIAKQNQRVTNNTISLVVSPEISDGKAMTNEQWKVLTQRVLSNLKVDVNEAQYLCFIHTEKQAKHAHIILNRVRDDGSLIHDHCIGKRMQNIVHQVAKEISLKSAREIRQLKEHNKKEVLKAFRHYFKRAHEMIIRKFPKDIHEYSELMKMEDFSILPSVNKQGDIQGYRVENMKTGENIKLSLIDRKIKLNQQFFESLSLQKEKNQKQFQSLENKIVKQQHIKLKL